MVEIRDLDRRGPHRHRAESVERRESGHLHENVYIVRPNQLGELDVAEPPGDSYFVKRGFDIGRQRMKRVPYDAELRPVVPPHDLAHDETDRVTFHERTVVTNADMAGGIHREARGGGRG